MGPQQLSRESLTSPVGHRNSEPQGETTLSLTLNRLLLLAITTNEQSQAFMQHKLALQDPRHLSKGM